MKRDWQDGGFRGRRRRSPASGVVVGAVVILVGILLLLKNLDIIWFHDVWIFWPVILIAAGLGKFFGAPGLHSRVWGVLLAAAGVLFLLENLGYLSINPRLVGPLALIGMGILFLSGALGRRQWRCGSPPSSLASTSTFASSSTSTTSDSSLNEWAVFGGVKRRVDSQAFTGGGILAVFGGVDIDLRPAGIQGEEAFIEANATFGGVSIRVPESWSVTVQGLGMFGGYEDHTTHAPASGSTPPKRLVVTGFAVFGGVEIKN
ncbi:MAG: DUF5668 domain-containing protein [Bryobacteraceae bacterium]